MSYIHPEQLLVGNSFCDFLVAACLLAYLSREAASLLAYLVGNYFWLLAYLREAMCLFCLSVFACIYQRSSWLACLSQRSNVLVGNSFCDCLVAGCLLAYLLEAMCLLPTILEILFGCSQRACISLRSRQLRRERRTLGSFEVGSVTHQMHYIQFSLVYFGL